MTSRPSDGLVLDGYRLIRFLGRGGFGEVWLCRSEAMGDFRALKWIPASNQEELEREYASLVRYRAAASNLRSPHLVAIEHANRIGDGLYYVMPLADGAEKNLDPIDPAWRPLTLAESIRCRVSAPEWFSSAEIRDRMRPVLRALQILSDAGLVHGDVKPDNILFFGGQPCLGDISLLGEDEAAITRRGTPGYVTPSWYEGGHPDMFGAAATLYTLLTGNSPDRMGRSAFLWPPQGETSLPPAERAEWKRLHNIVRRATEEQVSERFLDFATMARAIDGENVPARSRRRPVALAAAAVAVLGGLGLFLAFRNPPGNTATPRAASPAAAPSESAGPVSRLTPDQRADYLALATMVQRYLDEGQYANALASVEELLSTYPEARTQPGYSIARATALIGLGRTEEAKKELKKDVHLSPKLHAAAARKELWEKLGDLDAAEADLSRILETCGPNTLLLFLRADIRARRGDFPGVLADKQAALAIKPGDEKQRKQVENTWAPLESQYPAYAKFLDSKRRKTAGTPDINRSRISPPRNAVKNSRTRSPGQR
jgi:serine/threonine protein kinase